MKVTKALEATISALFGGRGVVIPLYKEEAALVVRVTGGDLIFENLQKLSELLGTKAINIHIMDDGRCDCTRDCYCSGESEVELWCSEIRLKND